MKSFKAVEANRADYHRDPSLNSVHRSSLTVPRLPGRRTAISFLNHFLVKRGYRSVACRITAVDRAGARIVSRLFPVTEPRVYAFDLDELFGPEAETWLVEFFTADNLFIPFPAVMVHHRGDGWSNMVHAYNRVLNDVFEDDAINGGRHVPEASIDVDGGGGAFVLFSTGPLPCRGALAFEYATRDGVLRREVGVDMPRLANRAIALSEVFGDAVGAPGTLRVLQPRQPMFYSRMLCGRGRADGVFTANHSYYDSSSVEEYWDEPAPSYRSYPYFPGLGNRIRMYPIMSPSRLRLSLELRGRDGRLLAEGEPALLETPGPAYAELSADEAAARAGIAEDDVAAFALVARADDGRMPTRVNHQVLYGRDLFTSINVSLKTSQTFTPAGKTGFTWGQVSAGGGARPRLAVAGDAADGPADVLEVDLYTTDGLAASGRAELPSGGAAAVDVEAMLGGLPDAPRDVWFVVRGRRPDLTAMALTEHAAAGQVKGDLGF